MFLQALFLYDVSAGIVSVRSFSRHCLCVMFQQELLLSDVSVGIVSVQCYSRCCVCMMFQRVCLYDVSAGIVSV